MVGSTQQQTYRDACYTTQAQACQGMPAFAVYGNPTKNTPTKNVEGPRHHQHATFHPQAGSSPVQLGSPTSSFSNLVKSRPVPHRRRCLQAAAPRRWHAVVASARSDRACGWGCSLLLQPEKNLLLFSAFSPSYRVLTNAGNTGCWKKAQKLP